MGAAHDSVRAVSRSRLQLRPAERLAAWLICGPLGHLVAGTLFFGELLARHWWAKARGRTIHAWDRPAG
jgi:hypothetical protein